VSLNLPLPYHTRLTTHTLTAHYTTHNPPPPQRKENILLYPGGVREGFKRKNEKYQLFWPQRSEFVRMAAKFGATIVPVASVGAEDCVNILMDTEDIKGHALLGGWRGVWGFGKGEGGRGRTSMWTSQWWWGGGGVLQWCTVLGSQAMS
jgi:hypothetical protein